jgi:beta-phosphoglucomutase
MEKANLNRYLDLIVSAEDVKNPKPAPEIYALAMRNLGFNPENCLIVEDNDNGIKAAIASGAYVLKVRDVEEVNLENIYSKINFIETRAA